MSDETRMSMTYGVKAVNAPKEHWKQGTSI